MNRYPRVVDLIQCEISPQSALILGFPLNNVNYHSINPLIDDGANRVIGGQT